MRGSKPVGLACLVAVRLEEPALDERDDAPAERFTLPSSGNASIVVRAFNATAFVAAVLEPARRADSAASRTVTSS